ncbi:MAG: hypothetical protein ABW189_09100 [Rickettsiales bacterium]
MNSRLALLPLSFLAALFATAAPRPAVSGSSPLETLLAEKLKHLGERQTVYARNLANADTPKYRTMTMESFSERTARRSRVPLPTLARTHVAHLRMKPAYDSRVYADKDAEDFKPNGNNVSPERESLLLGENAREQQETVAVMRKLRELNKIAIGGSP